MAFSIFKVVDLAGGKITAELVNNIQGQQLASDGTNYKFTFVKSTDLDITTLDEESLISLTFKYKDNF